jgi:hypothetical protein
MRYRWSVFIASAIGSVALIAGWTPHAGSAHRFSSALATPIMIQGRVTQVSPTWATIITPAWFPYCHPGAMCPMFIAAGRTYHVRLIGAIAETASGLPWDGPLFVGERVVVAGTSLATTPSHLVNPVLEMQAHLWEPLQSPVPPPLPCLRHRVCPLGSYS